MECDKLGSTHTTLNFELIVTGQGGQLDWQGEQSMERELHAAEWQFSIPRAEAARYLTADGGMVLRIEVKPQLMPPYVCETCLDARPRHVL